jgi:pimeloyl-ACP methyl ester carboxylesterase
MDTARVADALGLGQFAVMGHSGGAPYALACGALLRERVLGVVCAAGLAPFGAEGLDWFAGMAPYGTALLRAAAGGPAALEDYLVSHEFDLDQFAPADHAALVGDWAWLGTVARQAMPDRHRGTADDELAYVAPWGFDPGQVTLPVLVLHGGQDRIVPTAHGAWLARQARSAQFWPRPDDGHISVLNSAPAALDWLLEHCIP